MGFAEELFFAPAGKLVAMLRNRDVSSVELTRAYFTRIEQVNPRLNAIVTLVEERAIAEARDSDRRLGGGDQIRPLEGLPITIKDSISTADVRSTDGMKILEDHVPTRDAPTVARLRAAGAIVIAKTNVPEMAMDYDCANPVFGATSNPWNTDRVPGGSSGGEAAAVATGMSSLGLGSDYGGSIRVPSHFSGVAGLKPGWGTVPITGHLLGRAPAFAPPPPPVAEMATIGPLARCVDDLTLSYNIIKGPTPESPGTVPSPDLHPERVRLREIRCAVFTDGGGVPVQSAVRRAVERAAGEIQKLGVAVDEATPPVSQAARIWLEYAMADGNQLMLDSLGDDLRLSRPRLRNMMALQDGKSATELFVTLMERGRFRVELAQFMERYPIIICAPFCITAFEHDALEVEIEGRTYGLYDANWPALWVNCAGLPAAVVPGGKDGDGLPTGVQIVGRAFEEEKVLAVARALEGALGGFQKPPV